MISFVIPTMHGQDRWRTSSLYWNVSRLRDYYPDDQIVRSYPEIREPFNRGALINQGAKSAIGDVLCILDSDTVFNTWTLIRGLKALEAGAPWVIPYDEYYRTDRATGEAILTNRPGMLLFRTGPITNQSTGDKFERGYDHVLTHPPVAPYESPQSGMLLFRREEFLKMGGFNTDFEGWGYEDRGLVYAANTLIGPHVRTSGPVFHIWHPEHHDLTRDQPNIQRNRDLAERMKNAQGDRTLMRVINGPL